MSINQNDLLSEFKGNIKFDYNLKKRNWFNIGGKAKIFYKAINLKELIKFLKLIENKEKIFVLEITNQSESVTLKRRPDCLIMGKWVKPPASQHHCCGVPFCGGRYPLTVPLMANPLHG